MDIPLSRFDLARPEVLAEEYWKSVQTEVVRLHRSIETGDDSQALSDIKCLVECVSRIVLDLEGMPAANNAKFEDLVNQAHSLLAGQPGHQLANQSPFGQIATQASKIAKNLARIRNEYGGGHGRSRPPLVLDEMVALAIDGGLLWTRWALRRIGFFAMGRPAALISDLVGSTRATFWSGTLADRLVAANLPSLDERHQRSIGVAVGQRASQGTFVVRNDGVFSCIHSDDLFYWPCQYRVGLSHGLWFDPAGNPTATLQSLQYGLQALEHVPDRTPVLRGLVDEFIGSTTRGDVLDDLGDAHLAVEWIRALAARWPEEDGHILRLLGSHVTPSPPP